MKQQRREFLQTLVGSATITSLAVQRSAAAGENDLSNRAESPDSVIVLSGSAALEKALAIASDVYSRNRVQDQLSFTNPTGFRMKLNNSYRSSICMAPDLTFGMFGSRYLADERYHQTFLGHLDALPRNMRRNGKFFINEDLLAGSDRVMTQVMYPIWIWELYLATGEIDVLERHQEPLKRCLAYIESRTNSKGVVRQVDHDDWQISEGADWVDWCPERMEGSTCVYHTWYACALSHCVSIFKTLGDQGNRQMANSRYARQRKVLDTHFWNGRSYYDNLNFAGGKVEHFWCDSQIWPIAFGFSSDWQSKTIFQRIDSEPDVFEGMPLRWCAPVPKSGFDSRYDAYAYAKEPALRPLSWFGRLGAGDVLARYATGQSDHAHLLLDRYAQVIAGLGTFPECVDMQGKPRFGTGGANDYLEHAGGLLLATGRGLMGLSDSVDGNLRWEPRLPKNVDRAEYPYWHKGHCWLFGYENGKFWIDPRGGRGTVQVRIGGKAQQKTVDGEKIVIESTQV